VLRLSEQGCAAPGSFGRESAAARGSEPAGAAPRHRGRGGAPERYDAAGERVRHFADDDAADLDTLVRRARHGDDMHDLDAAFAASVVKAGSGYKRRALDADAEYDDDAGLEMYERKCGAPQATVFSSALACPLRCCTSGCA
jgi:hypothetical protein